VTAPTLIQHGELDRRVPISQGYEFYQALKQQGVPVRMQVLPRQPHGPAEPKMLLRVMETNLEWFEKYLGQKQTPLDVKKNIVRDGPAAFPLRISDNHRYLADRDGA